MPKLQHPLATVPSPDHDYTLRPNSIRIVRKRDGDTTYPWLVDGVRIVDGVVVAYTENAYNFVTWGEAMRLGPEWLLSSLRQAWCVWCQEYTPVEWREVDDPDVPECRHCGATDLTPPNR